MNVLVINHYAGSPDLGMEFRPYYLAREWVRRGHEVTIVAASFSHVRTKNPEVPSAWKELPVDGIRYLWLSTPRYGGNDLRRVRNMGTFVSRLFFHHGKILRMARPDAIIASSTYPLDIFPAWLMARRAGARLVFEVHDLWPLSPVELGGYSRRHPFIVVMQAAEDFAYVRSDHVISLLPMAKDYMVSRGMAPEKFIHLPNGIDVSAWQSPASLPEKTDSALSRIRLKKKFILGYAGSHGLANALDELLEAAETLREIPEIHFLFVGDGPKKEELTIKAHKKRLGNVTFLPPVPKAAIPGVLEKFDAAYLGWRREALYRFGISPNKLMDYMMAGKPVIHAVEAGNDPVAESSCGFSIPPEDPIALSGAIRKMAALSVEEREQMGRRGRAYVLRHHDYRQLADKFLRAMEGRQDAS